MPRKDPSSLPCSGELFPPLLGFVVRGCSDGIERIKRYSEVIKPAAVPNFEVRRFLGEASFPELKAVDFGTATAFATSLFPF